MGRLTDLGQDPRSTPGPTAEDARTPVRAAGAVLWREADRGGIEIALVHRPKYDDWSLPKGKLEPGEHAAVAAVREVREETGVACVLGRDLGIQSYAVGERLKVVRYWAAEARGGRFTPTREVDRVAWLPPDEAETLLSYRRDTALVRELASAPWDTVPVIVLRHAAAVARSRHSGDDADRPLTAAGREHAEILGGLLAAYAPTVVLGSPALRCLASVDPFCRRGGVAVEAVPALSEEGHSRNPGAAAELVRALVAEGTPAVVCTHRPVLPGILAVFGQDTPPGRAREELVLPGEFVVLHTSGGTVVAADRHTPYAMSG